jgi:hypothetical protein
MKRRGLAIALCLLAASTASAQTKTPLEGAGKSQNGYFLTRARF